MENEEIEQSVLESLEYLSRYPIIVFYFRKFETLSSLYENLKKSEIATTLRLYEKQKKGIDWNDKHYWSYFKKVVETLKQTETEINEEESKQNFRMPTYSFDKELIFLHSDKIKTKSKKLNYLNYIKLEYPEHLVRRYKILNKNTIKLVNEIAIESIMSRYLAQLYIKNKFDFNRIMTPLRERTLPERLEAEIAYYNGYIEEIPTGNVNPEIDINELLEQISDSKSTDINDPHQLMKVIGKHLKIDFDLENTPIIEKITKQTKNSEKIKKEVKYYTIKEVCDLLRIGRTKLYHLRRDGVLSFSQYGRQIRFPKSEIDEYIRENTVRL